MYQEVRPEARAVCPSARLSVSPSPRLSARPSARPPVRLSLRLSVCPSAAAVAAVAGQPCVKRGRLGDVTVLSGEFEQTHEQTARSGKHLQLPFIPLLHPAAVRCNMVLHRAFRARHVRENGVGGEVRHGVTSGVSRETYLNNYVTPHLHRE